jgi:hypothetical protein
LHGIFPGRSKDWHSKGGIILGHVELRTLCYFLYTGVKTFWQKQVPVMYTQEIILWLLRTCKLDLSTYGILIWSYYVNKKCVQKLWLVISRGGFFTHIRPIVIPAVIRNCNQIRNHNRPVKEQVLKIIIVIKNSRVFNWFCNQKKSNNCNCNCN